MYNQLVSWTAGCGDTSARSRSLYRGNRVVLCNWLFHSNVCSQWLRKRQVSFNSQFLSGQCATALLDNLDALCKEQLFRATKSFGLGSLDEFVYVLLQSTRVYIGGTLAALCTPVE